MMLKIPQANINKTNIPLFFVFFFLNVPSHIKEASQCELLNQKEKATDLSKAKGREKLASGKKPRTGPNSGELAICFGQFV